MTTIEEKMVTIQEKLLSSGYKPVSLKESDIGTATLLSRGYRPVSLEDSDSDIGREFLFVSGNMKTRGIFDGFINPQTGLAQIIVPNPIPYNPIRSSNSTDSTNSTNPQSFFKTLMISTSKGLDEDGNKIGDGHLVFRISDIHGNRAEMISKKKSGVKLPHEINKLIGQFGGRRKRKRKTQRRIKTQRRTKSRRRLRK